MWIILWKPIREHKETAVQEQIFTQCEAPSEMFPGNRSVQQATPLASSQYPPSDYMQKN